MGKFAKIEEVKASGDRLPYFLEGRYTVRILAVREVESRKGDLFIIVECHILASSNKDVRVGGNYAQAMKWNDDMGPINVKRFILACNGLDPNDDKNNDAVGEEEVDLAVGESQPLAGIEIELQCDAIKTRSGGDFTKHTWLPVQED